MTEFLLMAAPIQGFTDAVYRNVHSRLAGGVDAYFSPFIRLERGEVRQRDLRDITLPITARESLVPQIIFRDFKEFEALTQTIMSCGFDRIDLNMGCPFTPQVRKGRGAGVIGNTDTLYDIRAWANDHPEIKLSVKMRLGVAAKDEWRGALDILNIVPLTHITVHPRTAVMQYSGDVDMQEFAAIVSTTVHRVIYNGEIHSPADIDAVREKCPAVAGVMVGRGLLARPTLFSEWRNSCEMTLHDRLSVYMQIHRELIDHYSEKLCGDTQILSKLVTRWEYAPDELPRKEVKKLKKTTSLSRYNEAFETLRRMI